MIAVTIAIAANLASSSKNVPPGIYHAGNALSPSKPAVLQFEGEAVQPVAHRLTMAGSPLGIGWGFLYGYQGAKAWTFMPQLRELGAGISKIYLFWNQIEPAKGQYDWSAVDAFVHQLRSRDEGLVSLFSSSTWAVRQPSAMLPPSPAKNPADYYRFVYDLVKHCKGKVRFWENDAEPNNPIYWLGTKQEFVAELKIFYKAVKDADPGALVVAGGYDGLFNPPGMPPKPGQQAGLDFFDCVIKEGHSAFDVFDLRLYGDPYSISGRVEFMRQKMVAAGSEKPIISTEYGGPGFFEFPVNRQYAPIVAQWSKSVITGAQAQPALNPIAALYQKMSTLAPETQMFMQGATPELEGKYQRIQARGLVMRNLFAFASGVQKALYWQFASTRGSRDDLMTLMYSKIGMFGEEKGVVKRYPIAEVYQRMARHLKGVTQVRQILIPDRPTIELFLADRARRGALYVVWERRDMFLGEDSPAVPFEMSWNSRRATAEDALGRQIPLRLSGGRLRLPVSLTPIFVEP